MRWLDNCITLFSRRLLISKLSSKRILKILAVIIITLNSSLIGASALEVPSNNTDQKSFHLVWRNETPAFLRNKIQMLDENNFDKLYIGVTRSVCLEYKYWDCRSSIWSAQELISIIEYAQSYDLIVAIEIKMLNKTKKSFEHLKNMHFNDETLDPRTPEFVDLYNTTFKYVANVLGVSEIVIGFDEIYGFSSKDKLALNKADQLMLPSSLFIRAVNTAHVLGIINDLSVSIWGDMLIDNNSLNCPGSKHNHGNYFTGYNSELLPYIPKNVKVISWYYKNTNSFCGVDLLKKKWIQCGCSGF
ncbi:hypothetical protein N8388_02725 [Octadecabacter sp.]|nr:hypothetical protein [Octadecabacter sp.]